MQVRFVTPALVLGLLVFPVLSLPDSNTDRYRFEIETVSVTDLSEMGQGEMENTVHIAGELSVTFAEDGRINIVLDTMTGSSEGQGQQVTPQSLAQMIGTSWNAVLDEKGRLSELVADSGSSQAAVQLEGNLLRGLFPYVAPGASVGDTWSDTLSFSSDTDASSQATTTYMEYTASADTTYNSVEALAVEATYTATTTIYQDAQGGIDIEGASTGSGVHYIATNGKYLGGVREMETELEVSGPQIPAIIPVAANTTLIVELLP